MQCNVSYIVLSDRFYLRVYIQVSKQYKNDKRYISNVYPKIPAKLDMGVISVLGLQGKQYRLYMMHVLPDRPPTSIFFKFFASKITTVSFPAVGT